VTVTAARGGTRTRTGWPVVTGLLLLSALPIIGGAFRLGELSTGTAGALSAWHVMAAVAHIVAMTAYCLLGAFQFSPALRGRNPWHRRVGLALVPTGISAALASIGLALLVDGPAEEHTLAIVRVVFAVPMALFLALGATAIARHDYVAHAAWMTRAFAIAVTGGTQALVLTAWSIVSDGGETTAATETAGVAVGFLVNSLVAEVIIRRRRPRRLRRG
jgi:hypothetical protein